MADVSFALPLVLGLDQVVSQAADGTRRWHYISSCIRCGHAGSRKGIVTRMGASAACFADCSKQGSGEKVTIFLGNPWKEVSHDGLRRFFTICNRTL
jgi:hypothetical protein